MSFTSFKTWTVGDVLTASDLNTYVRDNGNVIEGFLVTRTSSLSSGTVISVTAGAWSALRVVFDGLLSGTADTLGFIYGRLNADSTSANYKAGFNNIYSSSLGNLPSILAGTLILGMMPISPSASQIDRARTEARIAGTAATNDKVCDAQASALGTSLKGYYGCATSAWLSSANVSSLTLVLDGGVGFAAGTVCSVYGIQ